MRYPLKNWKQLKRGYGFGEPTFYSSHHFGADYIVPEGTPVYAPASCEIIVAADFPEGGKTIHVQFRTQQYGLVVMRCLHLSKFAEPGKYKAGEIIGYTGNTGKLTRGPHLHLDISRKIVDPQNTANFIDPEKFFKTSSSLPVPNPAKTINKDKKTRN